MSEQMLAKETFGDTGASDESMIKLSLKEWAG